MRIEFAEDERGRCVARKHAADTDEAARLRREADLLDVATHPGLVEPLDFVDGPEPVLTTLRVGRGALGEGKALELEDIAGVVAATASTVADLHGVGLVHGAIAPGHVLLDDDGRPVLCGLGYGGLAGERVGQVPDIPAAYVDPARPAGEPLDPAFDVFGLGAWLTSLLDAVPGGARGDGAEAVHRLAAQALAPTAAARPSARELADALHDSVPGARLPHRDRGGAERGGTDAAAPTFDALAARHRLRPLERWRRSQVPPAGGPRPPLRLVGMTVAVVVCGAAVAWVAATAGRARSTAAPAAPVRTAPEAGPGTPPTTAGAHPTTAVPVATTAPLPRPTTVGPARPGCPPVAGALTADVDGDGCPDAVSMQDGVVIAGTRRWLVGTAADTAAVGDWWCTGQRSLAVLDLDTGNVFAFAGWATPGHDVPAPLVGEVTGGRSLRAADVDGDGCNELIVERASGSPAVLHVPKAAA